MVQDSIDFTPKVWNIGDSLVITIPKHIAGMMGINKGDTVQATLKKIG